MRVRISPPVPKERLHVLHDDSYYEHHARHVFGHYLCGLEQTEISDKVVDLISDFIKEKENELL